MKKVLFGMLIGAGVALLYAPASGNETRAKLKDKATGLGNDVTDFVDKKKRHMTNKMEGYKAKARNMADSVREMIPAARNHHDTADTADMAMAGDPSL